MPTQLLVGPKAPSGKNTIVRRSGTPPSSSLPVPANGRSMANASRRVAASHGAERSRTIRAMPRHEDADPAPGRSAGRAPRNPAGPSVPGEPAPPGFLDSFAWHPEPELLGVRDEAVSREALRAAGAATWEAALDYLYDHAFVRAMGSPAGYAELRRTYFGDAGGPGAAPAIPTSWPELLDEFRARIAPHTVSAWHPRSYGYFTPPPLTASVLGEMLSQVTQQGVDVWQAGPVSAFVEEEVIRWLCDLVGYGRGSFGLLPSGGAMANFI